MPFHKIHVQIDEPTYQQARKFAQYHDVSLSALIRIALNSVIRDNALFANHPSGPAESCDTGD